MCVFLFNNLFLFLQNQFLTVCSQCGGIENCSSCSQQGSFSRPSVKAKHFVRVEKPLDDEASDGQQDTDEAGADKYDEGAEVSRSRGDGTNDGRNSGDEEGVIADGDVDWIPDSDEPPESSSLVVPDPKFIQDLDTDSTSTSIRGVQKSLQNIFGALGVDPNSIPHSRGTIHNRLRAGRKAAASKILAQDFPEFVTVHFGDARTKSRIPSD